MMRAGEGAHVRFDAPRLVKRSHVVRVGRILLDAVEDAGEEVDAPAPCKASGRPWRILKSCFCASRLFVGEFEGRTSWR